MTDLRPLIKTIGVVVLCLVVLPAVIRLSGVDVGKLIIVVFSLTPLIALYLLPGFVASRRKKVNREAIWVVTILLGWTVIGWIAALIWAFVVEEKDLRASR